MVVDTDRVCLPSPSIVVSVVRTKRELTGRGLLMIGLHETGLMRRAVARRKFVRSGSVASFIGRRADRRLIASDESKLVHSTARLSPLVSRHVRYLIPDLLARGRRCDRRWHFDCVGDALHCDFYRGSRCHRRELPWRLVAHGSDALRGGLAYWCVSCETFLPFPNGSEALRHLSRQLSVLRRYRPC